MNIDLADYETRARTSVRKFWCGRLDARMKQAERGRIDQGERSAVTGGKNMDGFINLMLDLVRANGLSTATLQRDRAVLTLPGYFRPTKVWDLLVIHQGQLIAALEFKSQVGPSFGNNFNNRTEEALGTAVDFWTAFREGAFGDTPRPFVGWLMLLEDTEKSRRPVRDKSRHFPLLPEFQNASYADRYHQLCRKLSREALYTEAALLLSPRSANRTGEFSEIAPETGLGIFVKSFATHIALTAARLK